MYQTTEAIILKKKELSEADNIIVCYTKDFGKMSFLAKGARKSESKLKGHFEPMTHCKITFVNGKRMILTDAETIDSFFILKNNYKKLNASLFILKLIDKSINGEEKDEKIFKLILEFFKKLHSIKNLNLALAEFELEFLHLLGYSPDKSFIGFDKIKNSSEFFILVNVFFEKILGEKLPKIIL